MGEKVFKAGGTTTETNARLKEITALLNSVLEAQSVVVHTKRPAPSSVNLQPLLDALALESTLSSIDSKDFATESTSTAILAKIIAAPATEAKQDTMITSLASLDGKDFATETTLATLATQTTLMAVNSNLTTLNSTDFATQTTLAAVLAKIIAAPATEAKQDTMIAADAANFATQIASLATLVAQGVTHLAALVVDAASSVSRNALLTTANTNTAAIDTTLNTQLDVLLSSRATEATLSTVAGRLTEGGQTVAEWLESLTNQTVFTTGDIEATDIANNERGITVRPNGNLVQLTVRQIEVTNNNPSFPVVFRFYLTNGTHEHLIITTATVAAAGGVLLVEVNERIQRDHYLLVRASVDGGGSGAGHRFETGWYGDAGSGDVTVTAI